MLLEVGEFCARVEDDLNGLIDELQALTGRYGDHERKAWQQSLPKVSVLLAKPQLKSFHVHLGTSGGMALEYRLPASSSWCDVVLLGMGQQKPAAVVVELKDWDTTGDRPGPCEGLIYHRGELKLHPSDQVRGYTEYCRRFHSSVISAQADVWGCVYFTRNTPVGPYLGDPHAELTRRYPIFNYGESDLNQTFPQFLAQRLTKPHQKFAEEFEKGVYKQDRNFCQQMAEQILHPEASPFVLLDSQRLGYELCLAKIYEALARGKDSNQKIVIVIQGPPGSGKSVLAVRLWAALVSEGKLPTGNIVFTTTSASQKSNWMHMFEQVAFGPGGRGVVKPANEYAPGTIQWVSGYKKRTGKEMSPDTWRENLKILKSEQGHYRCRDHQFKVSIVDEAHALINPEHKIARGGVTGWPGGFGPQGWHIIRASQISVFLMDSDQSFRDIETTSVDEIKAWAEEFGALQTDPVDLSDGQYRCAGSKEYIEWLEHMLGFRESDGAHTGWRLNGSTKGKLLFEIVDNPQALENKLRERARQGETVRIVAPFAREWKTAKESRPHDLPPEKMDFDLWYVEDGARKRWSRIWNFAPGQDYTKFIQAPLGTRMHADPLCEVGCPYTVRGFDYTYLGILWMKDLVWRQGRWVFDLDHIHESALKSTRAQYRNTKTRDAEQELLRRLQQIYRILLSRAIKGFYLWFEDQDTRDHVQTLLKG